MPVGSAESGGFRPGNFRRQGGDSADPLVSVIIPCFNAAKMIERTLASVRRQTYSNIEIIVVDDCSTDDTLAILRGQESHGVRVIAREHNSGSPSAPRNDGIAAARGAFLAFLDQDDEWHPDKLRRQIAVISQHEEMALIGCRSEEIWPDGSRTLMNATHAPPVGREAWRTMLRESFYVPSMIVARTETVRRIGGFDESLRSGEEDQDFAIRTALEGEVGFLDQVLAIGHEHAGNMSKRVSARMHETTLPMILAHCRALRKNLTRGELRQILGARYAQTGRNVYALHPGIGARLLLQAIALRREPLANLWYLITASPWGRWFKQQVRARRGQQDR